MSVMEGKWYATRLATFVLVRREDGRVTFVERDVWTPSRVLGSVEAERRFDFTIA